MRSVQTTAKNWIHRRCRSEFFRYFLVSAIAFFVDFAFFSFGIRFVGLLWPIAAAIGFFFGVFTAYFLSIRFVFSQRRMHDAPFGEFVAFFSVGLAGLGVTQLTLWIGIEWLEFNPEISKVLAAGFTFLFNFLVRKLALFNTPITKDH